TYLHASTGREIEALALMEQAASWTDREMRLVFSHSSDRQRLDHVKSVQTHRDQFLSLVFRHFRQSSGAIRAAMDLILRRKAVAAEATMVQRDAVLGGRYPALQGSLQELASLRMQITHQMLTGPGPEGPQTHRHQLDELKHRQEWLEAELARRIPEMNLER